MKKNINIIIFLVLSFNLFSQSNLQEISSKKTFDEFQGLPLNSKYGSVSAIKVVYDLKTEKFYYLNSKFYKYHHEFCRKNLNYSVDVGYFNAITYSNDERKRFLLGNINYYKSQQLFALEISPIDLMTFDEIILLHESIKNSFKVCDTVFFLLNSSRLLQMKNEIEKTIPTISPDEIYKDQTYQAVSSYENNGILKFIQDLDKEVNTIKPENIIVINETPLVLPNVAGIIVTEFQTPLSHLTILGRNRKISIFAYKNAYSDENLLKYEGEKINLKVTNDSFEIEKVDVLKIKKINEEKIKLSYDLSVNTLVNIEDLNKRSFKYAGNKASNFGILYKLSLKNDFKTPESAFVIPFYFYNEHAKKSGADILINNLISNKNLYSNDDSVRFYLDKIQEKIKTTPIDKKLLSDIEHKILELGPYRRMRFRSSTNAEDTDGFCGAGLYTSKTGIVGDDKKTIEKAVQKVWSSLWYYQAFMEREYFNIDHSAVFMGVLVHRSFPNESVNGVAITKNPYRSRSYGFLVNAQIGDVSVVSPPQGIISDQFVCYPNTANDLYKKRNTVDIITTSNLNNGVLVMTDDEIQKLANQLNKIKEHFYNSRFQTKTFLDYGLDLEFKLDGPNRDLYIKQIRIYND